MPHFDNDIPQNIFHLVIKVEFERKASSTIFLDGFIPKSKELLKHMETKGSKSFPTKLALRKIILSHKQDL